MCRVRQDRCSLLLTATHRHPGAVGAAATRHARMDRTAATPRVPTAGMAAIRVALLTADTPAGTRTDHPRTEVGRILPAVIPADAVTRDPTEVRALTAVPADRMEAEATANAN